MKLEQREWLKATGWQRFSKTPPLEEADLVMVFGDLAHFERGDLLRDLKTLYPRAHLFGASTAGEIRDTRVQDGSFTATAIRFEGTRSRGVHVTVSNDGESEQAGRQLAEKLAAPDLVHVIVFSVGLGVNGSELVRGLSAALPAGIKVTGGLAGDGGAFKKTLVVSGDACDSNIIAAVGLYGSRIRVGYGSVGGWDPFGPERLVTRSTKNVLYQLDGKSALDLYKTYLGDQAKGLPASGLLFPLSLRKSGDSSGVVRTILGIDEQAQSLTFAGDVPVGHYVQLMRANFDRLVDGAADAATAGKDSIRGRPAQLALLISCVGRKLVLQQRIEEETEAVRHILGTEPVLTGFYSYGEISPFTPDARCELHNQTMTITTLSEELDAV